MTWSNGNSFSVGNGACVGDRKADSLPWLFRLGVPGFEGGWRR